MHADRLTRYAMSVSEAAEYLDVSVGHLYNLISRGRAPRHIQYGRHRRFARADLDAWIARRCRAIDPADRAEPLA